ncbi:MAG: TetR/AcrR family transcriptional regulator, partial [Gemmatimonadales bacterium]
MPGLKVPEAIRREQILEAAYHVAAKRGLQALRIQEVAARAGVSHGLVLFHFKSKRGLLLALLDWLLATTTVVHLGPEILRLPSPTERLRALLRQEMGRLGSEPQRIRLTFDFWTASIRDAVMRSRMRGEFQRYRDAFRPLAESVLADDPERFRGVTAAGLAAVSVGFIKGCAVQAMIDQEHFNIAEFLDAA